ncbi:hypothetical protein GCM10023213_30350 [Prosthecobacter algae]|uniref:Uncharacterized protein n=1 Tax=Prosthecobacter algae TaxID=1144682 RepID=A0ABP9PGD5_9BACT
MSTSLDPTRLRFLLQNLHNEFPGVDYATLVRTVMEVESHIEPDESWDDYCGRIRDSIESEHAATAHISIRRIGKITRARSLVEVP